MVAVTYGNAGLAGAVASKPWYARLMDAMVESRMRQAEREVRMHTQLRSFTSVGDEPRKGSTEDLPFGGW